MELGIEYCVPKGYLPLTIETDSFITKRIVDGVWDVPWIVTMDVKSIKVSLHRRNVEVIHTFTEVNKLADFLTSNNFFCTYISTFMYYKKDHKLSFSWKKIKSRI